jgi:YD repeat-containing protein
MTRWANCDTVRGHLGRHRASWVTKYDPAGVTWRYGYDKADQLTTAQLGLATYTYSL